MSYLIGSGWWILWYIPLWLSVAPYAVMTAMLVRASPDEPMLAMETAFAIGSVGLFVLVCATAISGILWTIGSPSSSAWIYIRNVGGAILLALFVGLVFIFGAAYYAVTPKLPMLNRWAAQLLCLASSLFLLWICLHATWRFRHR